jgi:hypothetical protein
MLFGGLLPLVYVLFLVLVFVLFCLELDLNRSFLLALLLFLIGLVFLIIFSFCLFFGVDLLFLLCNFDAYDSLVSLHTRKRLESFQVIVLANLVDSFDKLENVPTTNNPICISRQQKIPSLITDLLHVFDPPLVGLEMNAMLIMTVLPYLDLTFLG